MTEYSKEGKITYSSFDSIEPNDVIYMLKDLPDACCIFKVLTDPFGTVKDMLFLFANEKYSQLVGIPVEDLIGNTYYKTVPNRDEDWIKYSYQAAILRQSSKVRTYNTQFDKWHEFWSVPVYKKGFCAFVFHDVTGAKKSEDNIKLASNTSKLIIDCATALSSAEFGKGIKKVLMLLGKTIEADRVGVVEVKDKKVTDTHEWINNAGARTLNLPGRKAFEEVDVISIWNQQLGDKNTVLVNGSADISKIDEDVYYNILDGSISRYSVSVMRDNDEIIGYLVADNYAEDLPLNVGEVMESVAIFISYEMRNRALTKEMTYLGSHDALTGLGNRYALNQTLLVLSGVSTKVGVSYLDINGMKNTNETEGHDAGDERIKKTADIFASVFKRKYCYRIGGDEFLAIIPEIAHEKFDTLVSKLKAKTEDISVAIGAVWTEDSKEINLAVKQADERMYEDKASYYKAHGRRHSDKISKD
ncbi:sensor domain-containing diguanylate cyclase [Butyrivibrio sp. X503]|uniref:sensor domain-containing diguanylate cyclase n=1 Tax=Butyrivibrio sp. X503 TaxID=2364878 RepID=UPI001FA9B0F3|nr:sensor domain-containing diguanylate cyclase [Butyrivibrio sp. X503]